MAGLRGVPDAVELATPVVPVDLVDLVDLILVTSSFELVGLLVMFMPTPVLRSWPVPSIRYIESNVTVRFVTTGSNS